MSDLILLDSNYSASRDVGREDDRVQGLVHVP